MIPPQSPETFQPYGFLLRPQQRRTSPRSSAVAATTATTGASTAAATDAAAYVPALIAESEHGAYLARDLELIVPPVIAPREPAELPASSRCLFIGHLRFETTTADVRWMIKKLTDVNPLRADIRGNGCCVVYLASEADANAVRLLSRRILFDRHGFWFARTGDAVDVLMDYVEKVLPNLGCTGAKRRSLRLPRDAIVVEDSRSSKHHRRSQQQQQQQQQQSSTSCGAHQPRSPYVPSGMSSVTSTPHFKTSAPLPPMSPMLHASLAASYNFHDSPPDYVNPPTACLGDSRAVLARSPAYA